MKIRLAIGMALLMVCTATATAQSLADAARKARQNKRPPTKVWDNESLPKDAVINVGTTTVAGVEKKDEAAAEAKEGAPSAEPASAEDKKKSEAEFRTKVTEQKTKIQMLERELDVAQREQRLKAAAFYGDAGSRLRDEKKFAEDDRKAQSDIAEKQKQVEAEKAKLEDMREAARKAGLPPVD